jgi:ribosome biogenesis protein UTP30
MTVDADTLPLILAQASKAITSLQNYEEKRISAEKPRISLLGEDVDEEGKALASVWLVLGLQKIPEQRHVKPIKLALPKPWKCAEDELTTVCLITKDPQREYKDLIKPLGLKSVSKIIGVSKLRTKYKPFETRRQLCNGYDVFLADERILPMLPKILGKTFFDKKKIPIPVNLAKRKDLKQELKDAVECTPLHLGSGACISIKIGLANQSPKDLTSNVKSIIEQAVEKIPGKWNNIRSIHMKTAESISLPIYMPELK